MSEIAAPRSSSRARSLKGGGRNRSGQTNFELYSWLFMRLSGLALVILVLGHLFVNLILGGGITALDFGFVAGKWANPLWQVWDLLMLWLAMLHGSNGLRTIINDYAEKDQTRF
jgi:succinate dehydrogenase / fumarate reductase membrane anchor subunit